MPIYKSDESVDVDNLRFSAFSRSLDTDYPGQPVAIIDAASGQTISRKELKDRALRFAYGLRNLSKFGKGGDLKRGDMLSVFSINTLDYPFIILGAFAAGIRIALSSPVQTPRELAHQFKITSPSFFIVHPAVLSIFVDTMALVGIGKEKYMKHTVLVDTDLAKVPQSLRSWALLSDLINHNQPIEPERFDGPAASEVRYNPPHPTP
jgi:4-coumarate--CoA ligase